MTTSLAATSALSLDDAPITESPVQQHAVVYNCTRLGRTANPPRFSLADWFRFGRLR